MDEATRKDLLEVLPRAHAELEKKPGDHSSVLRRLDELNRALQSGKSIEEALDSAASEFLDLPRLLGEGIGRRAASTEDLPDKDEHPLAYLGNVIVKLSEEKK